MLDDRNAAQENRAAATVPDPLGDETAEDDGGAVFDGDCGDQFLSAEGGNGIARDDLLTHDVVVDLGDAEGDFVIGVDQGDDFEFENNVTVVDAGAGRGDAADARAIGQDLGGYGDALT